MKLIKRLYYIFQCMLVEPRADVNAAENYKSSAVTF